VIVMEEGQGGVVIIVIRVVQKDALSCFGLLVVIRAANSGIVRTSNKLR